MLRDIYIWIAYRIEPALNFSYWLGTGVVGVASVVFLGGYDPIARTVNKQWPMILPVLSALLAFMLNLRPKENIVADRLSGRRMFVLLMTLLSLLVLFGGMLFPERTCVTTAWTRELYRRIGIDVSLMVSPELPANLPKELARCRTERLKEQATPTPLSEGE
jgi:hypothetical protein